MAKQFLIKAAKNKDVFGIKEASEFLYFYCFSLKDLYGTLRCITAKGYRIRKPATLSKHIKQNGGHIEYRNPFFRTLEHEIWTIKPETKPYVGTIIQYKNSFGFEHALKIVEETEAIKTIDNQ